MQQISQENTWVRGQNYKESLFNKVAANQACDFAKIRHRCFPTKFFEIFKNTYFEEHLPTERQQDTHPLSGKKNELNYLTSVALCCLILCIWIMNLCGSKTRQQFLSLVFTEESLCSSVLDRDVMQRCIYNPVEHLRWGFLRKYPTTLEKTVPESLH